MEADAQNSKVIDLPQSKSDVDFTEKFHEPISFENNVETSDLDQSFDERNNTLDDLTDNAKNRSDLTKNQLETIQRQSEEIEILKKQMNYMQTIQKQKEEIANLKKQLQYQEIILNSNINNEITEKEYTPKSTIKESNHIELQKAKEVVNNSNDDNQRENGLEVIADLKHTAQGPRIILQGIGKNDFIKDEMKKINLKVAEKFMKALKDAKLNGQTPPCQVKVKFFDIKRQHFQ